MKMNRTKSQHNIGILSVESYSCHCHHHCHCDHHRHRCCHRHLHCHQYKHCCVIFIESWYFALIFIRYLEDQWSQGPIHPTPGTALEELRTRPIMHMKHLMECWTGLSRWNILKQMNDDIIQNWRTLFLSNSSHQWCLQARFTAFVVNVKKF